jgi:hypothetical protein
MYEQFAELMLVAGVRWGNVYHELLGWLGLSGLLKVSTELGLIVPTLTLVLLFVSMKSFSLLFG